MANPVVWWEIQVEDVDQACAFYGAVFGWTFQTPMGPSYAIILADGDMVGGIANSTGAAASGVRTTRIYLDTSDMESTLAKVESNGGKVVDSRALISEEFGWYATFTDPSGVLIGLSTSNPPSSKPDVT
jgi:predicted enzyme related to lactoylglutathione lyase